MSRLDLPETDDFEALLAQLRLVDRGPYLIFDLAAIERAAATLAAMGRAEGVSFVAAAKALPFDGLLDAASACGGGFDVSNEGELARIGAWLERRGAGPAPYLAITGPGVERSAMTPRRLAPRLTVNIESQAQLPLLARLAPWAETIELGLRIGVTPAPEGAVAAPAMTRFGFPPDDRATLAALSRDQRFAGLHAHRGGDRPPPGTSIANLEALLSVARALPVQPRVFNLGGGLRSETPQDIRVLCRRARALAPPQADILFEPGAWLAAQGGYGLTRVLAMTHRQDLDATIVTVDLSRDCHLRWSDLSLDRWWGPSPPTRRVLVFGPTCHEGDFLGAFDGPAAISQEPGSASSGWVLFKGVTGYAAAFNGGFNGVEPAQVVTFGKPGGL